MFVKQILTWVWQNRVKSLIGATLLSGATYTGIKYVSPDPAPAPDPYPTYRLTVEACDIQQGQQSLLDTLWMKLMICNDNGRNALERPKVKIDSASIKVCNNDSVQFRVAREKNAAGRLTPMDSLIYRDVRSNKCELANTADPRFKSVRFCAKLITSNVKTDSLCLYFMAKVWHSLNTKPDTLRTHVRVPVSYQISRSETPALALAAKRATPH